MRPCVVSSRGACRRNGVSSADTATYRSLSACAPPLQPLLTRRLASRPRFPERFWVRKFEILGLVFGVARTVVPPQGPSALPLYYRWLDLSSAEALSEFGPLTNTSLGFGITAYPRRGRGQRAHPHFAKARWSG